MREAPIPKVRGTHQRSLVCYKFSVFFVKGTMLGQVAEGLVIYMYIYGCTCIHPPLSFTHHMLLKRKFYGCPGLWVPIVFKRTTLFDTQADKFEQTTLPYTHADNLSKPIFPRPSIDYQNLKHLNNQSSGTLEPTRLPKPKKPKTHKQKTNLFPEPGP